MNPVIRYISRNAERLIARSKVGQDSFWLFNPIIDGRRRYRWIPFSIRLVDAHAGHTLDCSMPASELLYVLRGWVTVRHFTESDIHYARYVEGDRITRRRWDSIIVTTTSQTRNQQSLLLSIIYG